MVLPAFLFATSKTENAGKHITWKPGSIKRPMRLRDSIPLPAVIPHAYNIPTETRKEIVTEKVASTSSHRLRRDVRMRQRSNSNEHVQSSGSIRTGQAPFGGAANPGTRSRASSDSRGSMRNLPHRYAHGHRHLPGSDSATRSRA